MVSPRALGLSFIALVVLAAPAVAQSGSFGNSVVIDGDALLIGEPNNTFRPGTVYLYKKVGGEWVESARITAPAAERARAAALISSDTCARGAPVSAASPLPLFWPPLSSSCESCSSLEETSEIVSGVGASPSSS